MPSRSPWNRVLCARSTSQAIELAADTPIPELNATPLPFPFEQLSFNAQKNARAVRRALGVRVAGLNETGWELWEETEEDREFFRDPGVDVSDGDTGRDGSSDVCDEEDKDSVFDLQGGGVVMGEAEHLSETNPAPKNDNAELKAKQGISSRVSKKESRPPTSTKKSADKEIRTQTSEETNAAEALRDWAITSSHKSPPAQAVEIITRSEAAPALLNIIVPKDAIADLLAPVVSAFTESAGSAFASLLMNAIVIPYSADLKAPAPRDIMQALVTFSERHWRVGVQFYEYFAKEQEPVNGAVAEIMVRLAVVITLDGAMQGLRAWCKATWGEDGIRVIEALLARCKTQAEVATIVIPALERNMIDSEKSVRFGKLLFTVVRDIPDVAEHFGAPMEAICSRSAVFLAKRALTMLRGKMPRS